MMSGEKIKKSRSTYINQWYRKKRVEYIKKFGGRCEQCGRTENLEFAHLNHNDVHGIGRGSNQRIRDIMKHPDNYILLCFKCHKAYDKGELTLKVKLIKSFEYMRRVLHDETKVPQN